MLQFRATFISLPSLSKLEVAFQQLHLGQIKKKIKVNTKYINDNIFKYCLYMNMLSYCHSASVNMEYLPSPSSAFFFFSSP